MRGMFCMNVGYVCMYECYDRSVRMYVTYLCVICYVCMYVMCLS